MLGWYVRQCGVRVPIFANSGALGQRRRGHVDTSNALLPPEQTARQQPCNRTFVVAATLPTIGMLSPDSEHFGACAVCAEALYVHLLITFLGFAIVQLELLLGPTSASAIGPPSSEVNASVTCTFAACRCSILVSI